jgi:hypothetical protein
MDNTESHLNLPQRIHGEWEYAINKNWYDKARVRIEKILALDVPVRHESVERNPEYGC